MSGKHKYLRVALALILCAALTGCAPYFVVPSEQARFSISDMPISDERAPDAPTGDARESELYRATLYYSSLDGNLLTPVQRTLWLSGDWRLERRLADELMRAPRDVEGGAVAPEGSRLISLEISGGLAVANIHLTGDTDLRVLSSALALTLNAASGIERVCVLIDGRAAGVGGLPLGAVSAGDGDMSPIRAAWAEDAAKDLTQTITRDAVLYLPSADGEYMLSEVRALTLSISDCAKALIDALTQPALSELARAGVPYGDFPLQRACDISVDASGNRVLNIHFMPEVKGALNAANMFQWQFLASVAMTITTFMPDLDGVRVDFGGAPIYEAQGAEGVIHFAGGVIRRSDFAGRVAAPVSVYFPDARGKLSPETRLIKQSDASSPRALIKLIFEGPRADALSSAAPADVSAADIIGVRVQDGIALINLTANFYRLAQSLNARQESLLAYSIVNTLTDMEGVKGVRIYIDGAQADTLAGNIWLRGVLMRNPGLT